MQNLHHPKTFGIFAMLFGAIATISNYIQHEELEKLEDHLQNHNDRNLKSNSQIIATKNSSSTSDEQLSYSIFFENIEFYEEIEMVSFFLCGACAALVLFPVMSLSGAHLDAAAEI